LCAAGIGSSQATADDAGPVGPQHRLAHRSAPDLELREVTLLEAFDQGQVAVLQAAEQVGERRLFVAAQLVHQGPAPAAHQQHFLAAGFAQAVGVLARPVDLDRLVAVLDQRDAKPASHVLGHQPFEQGGLAHAGTAGDAKNLHLSLGGLSLETSIFASSSAGMPKTSRQSSPNSSAGWAVRSEPLPQTMSLALQ
jgi:hypothetical protein